MSRIIILVIYYLLSLCLNSGIAYADTPPPNTVKAKLFTGDGAQSITATSGSLNVNVTGSTGGSSTVNQGTPNGGGANAWYVQGLLGRTWNLSSGTDSVNVGNFPSSFGRTWNLSSGTDSVTISGSISATNSANGNTGSAVPAQATQVAGSDGTNLRALKTSATGVLSVDGSAVTQPVSGSVSVSNFPSIQPVSQSGTWSTGRTWSLLNSTDSVNSVQSGTWNVGLSAGANTIGKVDQGLGGASAWKVDGSAVTQPVSIAGSVAVTGPLTDTQLRATAVPVSGTVAVSGTVPISAAALPLPSGASTSALQTTGNSSLSSIDTKTPALGQALAAASTPVVLPAAQITTLTPPTTVTVTQATGTNLHAVLDTTSTTAVTQATAANLNATVVQSSGANLHVNVDSAPSTAVTGTVTANAGTNLNTSALALSATQTDGTQRTKITDGTTNASVKAASTAAVGTDTALVVAISPNNTPVLPTGAATETSLAKLTLGQASTTSGQTGPLIQGAVTTNVPAYSTAQTDPVSITTRGALRVSQTGKDTAQIIRNDYSTTNVTTAAYVQLVASTTVEINRLHIFDSSGQDFVLAVGAAASEVDQINISPGGWDSAVDLYIPSGSRISIKSKSATASSGILLITGLK